LSALGGSQVTDLPFFCGGGAEEQEDASGKAECWEERSVLPEMLHRRITQCKPPALWGPSLVSAEVPKVQKSRKNWD